MQRRTDLRLVDPGVHRQREHRVERMLGRPGLRQRADLRGQDGLLLVHRPRLLAGGSTGRAVEHPAGRGSSALGSHGSSLTAASRAPRRAARGGLAGVLLALGGACLLSCSSPTIAVDIHDPNELRNSSQWVELAIFAEECPDKYTLADGTYPAPVRSEVIDDLNGESFQALEELEAATYGVALLLRDERCAIVGYSCATADLRVVRRINLTINYSYVSETGDPVPRGACEQPEVCERGRCAEPASEEP